MRILIAPNAFKGALSSPLAAQALAKGFRLAGPDFDLDLMPIADGGDDTLEVLVGAGGEVAQVATVDPLGRAMEAGLGLLDDGRTAVIEMAAASGLKLLRTDELAPLRADTSGTGRLMAEAISRGRRRIVIGVGGSATVDGGTGCLRALGLELLDDQGRPLPPGPEHLTRLARIEPSGLLPSLAEVEIQVACDVTNPLLGPLGAAAVFGPQKGAGPEEVSLLEAGLARFFDLAEGLFGRERRSEVGAGAAGGLAGGLAVCLGAELVRGIDLILDHLDADRRLALADAVITGEGRLDRQTLGGKGPIGLVERARKLGKPVIAVAGSIDLSPDELAQSGLAAGLSLVSGPMDLAEAMARTPELLELAGFNLGRLLTAAL